MDDAIPCAALAAPTLTITDATRPAAAYAFHNAQSTGSYNLYPEGNVSFTLITPSSNAHANNATTTSPRVPLPFSFTKS